MSKLLKNILDRFSERDILPTLCFGALLLIYWNEIGSNVRLITSALNGGMAKVIDPNSSNWCEQSVHAMVQCHKYRIYMSVPIIIISSLLFFKHKKLAFLCLFLPPFFSLCIAKFF